MKPIISEEKLLELLPHGSGIDSEWYIITHKNGNITATNSFHAMNEDGYYDGWMDFKVRLFREKKTVIKELTGHCEGKFQIVKRKGDISFDVYGNDLQRKSFNGLKDSLYLSLGESLKSILTQMDYRALTVQEVKKCLRKS